MRLRIARPDDGGPRWRYIRAARITRHFAVHRVVGYKTTTRYFTVTHIQTGYAASVGVHGSRQQATTIARRLEASWIKWDFRDAAKLTQRDGRLASDIIRRVLRLPQALIHD